MKKILFIASACIFIVACNSDKKNESSTSGNNSTDSSGKKPQSEFADPKYMDWGKKQLAQFESGDINSWLGNFSDSARYYWSGGDSLIGKKAITDYWKNRRSNVIDSIHFANDIWLPLKVNQPQKGPDAPGVWLMSWYQVNVKYKVGSKLSFWVHTDYHYDKSDKIDIAVQYIDMAPINKALGK
jgi:hypothetical protein